MKHRRTDVEDAPQRAAASVERDRRPLESFRYVPAPLPPPPARHTYIPQRMSPTRRRRAPRCRLSNHAPQRAGASIVAARSGRARARNEDDRLAETGRKKAEADTTRRLCGIRTEDHWFCSEPHAQGPVPIGAPPREGANGPLAGHTDHGHERDSPPCTSTSAMSHITLWAWVRTYKGPSPAH